MNKNPVYMALTSMFKTEEPHRSINTCPEPYLELYGSTGQLAPDGEIPDPFVCILTERTEYLYDEGPLLPDTFDQDFLIVSDRFYRSALAEGVDNMQAVRAILREEDGTVVSTDYWAVNLIGLSAVADLQRSTFTAQPGGAKIDTEFDRLVLDPTKAGDRLLFRLAENCSVILVHWRLRERLEKDGVVDLRYDHVEDIAV